MYIAVPFDPTARATSIRPATFSALKMLITAPPRCRRVQSHDCRGPELSPAEFRPRPAEECRAHGARGDEGRSGDTRLGHDGLAEVVRGKARPPRRGGAGRLRVACRRPDAHLPARRDGLRG